MSPRRWYDSIIYRNTQRRISSSWYVLKLICVYTCIYKVGCLVVCIYICTYLHAHTRLFLMVTYFMSTLSSYYDSLFTYYCTHYVIRVVLWCRILNRLYHISPVHHVRWFYLKCVLCIQSTYPWSAITKERCSINIIRHTFFQPQNCTTISGKPPNFLWPLIATCWCTARVDWSWEGHKWYCAVGCTRGLIRAPGGIWMGVEVLWRDSCGSCDKISAHCRIKQANIST